MIRSSRPPRPRPPRSSERAGGVDALVLVGVALIAAVLTVPGSMAGWVATVETGEVAFTTGPDERRHQERVRAAGPFTAGSAPDGSAHERDDAGGTTVGDDLADAPGPEHTDTDPGPSDEPDGTGAPAPEAEAIEGTLDVSSPTGAATVEGEPVSVPVTVQNTGTTAWTGMRMQVAVDQVPAAAVEVGFRHGACGPDAPVGAVLDDVPVDDVPVDDAAVALAVAPGEKGTLCVTVAYVEPDDPAAEVGFTVYVTVEGMRNECTTGGVTVPLTFTVPGAVPAPPASGGEDESIPPQAPEPALIAPPPPEVPAPGPATDEPAAPTSPSEESHAQT